MIANMHLSVRVEQEEVQTVGDLLDDFYFHHQVRKKELKKKVKIRPVLRPITLVLNPEILRTANHTTDPDIYVAVYYKHYFVIVTMGAGMRASHKLELFYQMPDRSKVMLGVFRSKFFFYDDKTVKRLLNNAIREESYFASDIARKVVVTTKDEKWENL